MLVRRLLLPFFITLLALFVMPASGFSAEWDAFPELKPREHMAIKRLYDGPKYRDLRTCFRRFDSRAGANYYGAMVEVTAESGSRSRKQDNAAPYASALYDAWTSEGILNAEDDILVVFGLRNRSIAVHPGPKWEKIGFDADTINQTIEASHFRKHLKRRRYTDALCSLITAVDLRLVSLQQKMEQRVAAIEQRLPELDTKLSGLHKQVAARFADLPNKEHPFGKQLLAQLAAARTQLDDATQLASENPKEAVLLADEVEAVLQPVRGDLKLFNRDMERLDAVEAEVATLKQSILEREDVEAEHPQLALLQVAKCETLAQAIRDNYEGKPWQVRDCRRQAELQLARAEVDLAEADVHHFYLKILLPLLALALLILGVLGFIRLRRGRRNRALTQLNADLSEWQRRLGQATQLSNALKLKAPKYFAPGRTPWTAQSAEVERPLRESYARVETLISQGNALVKKAQALQEASNPLNAKDPEQALNLLRTTPLQNMADANASQLLGALEDAQRDALGAIDAVADLQKRHAEQSAHAAEAITRADRALDARRALGLPAKELCATLQDAAQTWQRTLDSSADDPKQAADAFERIAAALQGITEQVEQGNRAVERIRGELRQKAEHLRQCIKQLRFAGIDLDKLRFDPAQDLSALKRDAAQSVDTLARTQAEDTTAAVNLLEANLDQLERRLEIVREAETKIPARLEALKTRSRSLKQGLMDLRYALKSLASQGNPQAYRASSKQVGRYQSQIDRLAKELHNAQKDYQLKRFLSATERLDAAEALLERADALVTELGDLEMTLGVTQSKCEQLLSACKSEAEQLQQKRRKTGIDPALEALIAEQIDAYQTLKAQTEAEQADWFEARQKLDSLQRSMSFLNTQADADLEAYSEAQQPAQPLHDERSASLSQQARAELARAKARYAEVHGAPFGYAVTGDCSSAKPELNAAAEHLDSENFPAALSAAEAAIEQIDLEDARAQTQALRNYREAQIRSMNAPLGPPNLEAFDSQRSHSGGHAALDEISQVEA